MKPRIVTVLIFLLLGAIVNIAVAWGCALCIHAWEWNWNRQEFDSGEWPRSVPITWPAERNFLLRSESAPCTHTYATGGGSVLLITQFGVPTRSLEMQGRNWKEPVKETWNHRYRFKMPRWATPGPYEAGLPLLPFWPGFAINTLFYAAILWMLFALLRVLRRWRRIKRGLCPACAYPVGASDLCTECGKPIPSPLRGRAREGVERTSSSTALNDTEGSTLPLPLPAREGSQRPASS
jgi:hypothetical protein